jgi:HSP20 family protein
MLSTLRSPTGTSTALRAPDRSRELNELYDQLGRWMTSVFDEATDVARTWAPLTDVIETPDAYLIEVDLPGVNRDDINVQVDGNELLITGELKEKEREGVFRHRTRRVGQFEVRTILPRDAKLDQKAVEANAKNGVLTVRIPKDEGAQAQKIEVNGE